MTEELKLPELPADRYSLTGDIKDANWILARDVREYARQAVLMERERAARIVDGVCPAASQLDLRKALSTAIRKG